MALNMPSIMGDIKGTEKQEAQHCGPCEPVSIPSSSPASGPSHPLNHPGLSPSHFEETPRHAVILYNVFQCIAPKDKSSLKDAVMTSVPLSIFLAGSVEKLKLNGSMKTYKTF